jgi:two-component system chemotaxis sensor kinase CheA
LITAAEAEAPPLPAVARILKVRATPEPIGDNDDSIYRYDRAGLLTALSAYAGKTGS